MPRNLKSSRREALLAAVRRGLTKIFVFALVGCAVGAGLALYRSDSHTASATVLVNPLQGNPFNPDGNGDDLINLESEAHLVTSDAVVGRVATAVGLGRDPVASGVEVSVPPNTQIITVEFTSKSAEEAEEVAQAFAEEYLQFRISRAEDLQEKKQGEIEAQIESENEKLRGLFRRQSAAGSEVDKALLGEEIESVSSQVSLLRTQLVQLETGALDPGQVVTPSSVAGNTGLIGVVAFGAAGALAGGIAALIVIIARQRAENRVHHEDDVMLSGLPTLGLVGESEVDEALALAEGSDGQSSLAPAIMQLSVSLLTREKRRPVTVLMVSASEEGVPAHSPFAMAVGLSLTGINVVVVDTTGRLPAPAAVAEEHGEGLVDVLSGRAKLSSTVLRVSDTLSFLPAGRHVGHDGDLMMGQAMRDMCDALLDQNTVVLVAAGAMSDVSTQAAASIADTIVVEAVQGETRLGDLTRLTDDAALFADAMLGVVLLRQDNPVRRLFRRGSAKSPRTTSGQGEHVKPGDAR